MLVSVSIGYVHGYNRRAPALSLLIVEPRQDLLRATLARYLVRASFAMAVLPANVAAAARMFAFDAVVVPPALDPTLRADVLLDLGPRARVIEIDDPLAVTRELRATALRRGRLAQPLRA